MARLEIALLGTFQVSKNGDPITQFETEPARALLAYLVMHAGTSFRRDMLADLLWPDQARAEALHALRQTLNRLRRAIEDKANPTYLHVTRQTIEFKSDSDYWLDTDGFTRLADTVHEHAHRRLEACCTCVQQLTEAADLYRGDMLSGFDLDSMPFQEWLTMEREHLHRQAMEACYHLATCHSQRGKYKQAQHYARRQLKLEPWREEAHRQLMTALALSGQRSAALAQYETCRRTLSEELGVEPEPETLFLYQRIRDGNLQVDQMPPHNLPAPLTRFVGRETELDQIAEQLNAPDTRLLTLVGPGGVGKTRLALAAARQAVAHFPDGVWFVPLIGVHEKPKNELHDRLATGIAGALEISFSGQDAPKTQILKHLKSREALLILDNFEHLISGADFVLEALRQAPKITVLVTSRERINARAERLVQIAGLPVPPQDDAPGAADYSSVQLFIDRAEALHGRGAPGTPDHNLAQVASVCRLVEGVPLAIELASAWAEQMDLAEIVTNLRHDVDFLSTTFQDVPERHRRLRAVFESSWRLLGKPEQRALAQLAVFQGDFDRAGAQRVAMRVTVGVSTTVIYLHDDHLGSTSLTTDAGGQVMGRVLYYPYGEERYTVGTLQTDYGYTGQRVEESLGGLMDYNARFYDPYLNRFINPDTIVPNSANPQSLNRYAYVYNNPLRYVDPSGHDPLDEKWQEEFRQHHNGRDPDWRDRLIRLFSIAFPDEWNGQYGNSFFYNEDGTYREGSMEEAFKNNIPAERSWAAMPDALDRLAGWYEKGETEQFVRDIGSLFGGLPDRFDVPSMHTAMTGCESGYTCDDGMKLPAHIWVGVSSEGVSPDLAGTSDWDANIHHWAWALVVGYSEGSVAGQAMNTIREHRQTDVDPYVEDLNARADIWTGNRAVRMGNRLWWFGHLRGRPGKYFSQYMLSE